MDVMESWHDFFVATAGAAAALAGLIIVAISVNIKDIINTPSLTARAASTIASLVLSLLSTSLMLIPGQGALVLGLEILLPTLITTVMVVHAANLMLRVSGVSLRFTWFRISLAILQVGPFLVGAICLIAGQDQGVGWVAAGVLLVFAVSVSNAWVLLVEVLR